MLVHGSQVLDKTAQHLTCTKDTVVTAAISTEPCQLRVMHRLKIWRAQIETCSATKREHTNTCSSPSMHAWFWQIIATHRNRQVPKRSRHTHGGQKMAAAPPVGIGSCALCCAPHGSLIVRRWQHVLRALYKAFRAAYVRVLLRFDNRMQLFQTSKTLRHVGSLCTAASTPRAMERARAQHVSRRKLIATRTASM